MRPIILHPKARKVLRRFPKEVRTRDRDEGSFPASRWESQLRHAERTTDAGNLFRSFGVASRRREVMAVSARFATPRHRRAFSYFYAFVKKNATDCSPLEIDVGSKTFEGTSSMPKVKPIIAANPEDLAGAHFGTLRSVAAKDMARFSMSLLGRSQGDCARAQDHARGNRKAVWDLADQGDRDPERRP